MKKKVGFYLRDETKKALDSLRDMKIQPNDMMDVLLKFDNEAAALFIDIYKKINAEKIENFNYLNTINGLIVFNDNYAEKIRKLPIDKMSEEDAISINIKKNLETLSTEDEQEILKMERLQDEINMCLKHEAIINKKYDALEKRVKILEIK